MSDGVYTWRGHAELSENSHLLCEKVPKRLNIVWVLLATGAVMTSLVIGGAFIKRGKKEW